METHALMVDEVKQVIVQTLGIEDRARTLEASTPLFGSMPELELADGRRAGGRLGSTVWV